ncbi:disintegrin and metalloproteinase domain-containing protein 15 isoform X2 [Tiliqua scincoides]|uniref:disintegrin and metalloproteinase domain-containing protein 15 isoform X2 n=1 Tax=Tiliqua scincoides TaxID=71010 RepID=UPI003461FC45
MGLLWGLGVLLASWGCLGWRDPPRPSPGSAQSPRSRPPAAQRAGDGSVHWLRDEPSCRWHVVPWILQGSRILGLQEAELWQKGFPAELQIVLEVEGERLLMDLAQNWELLASTQALTHYLPDGTRATHRINLEGNCCYRGSIRGYLDSWANVCVCSGLSGLLVLSRDRSYGIEPTVEGTQAYRLEVENCTPASLVHGQFHPRPDRGRPLLRRAKRETESERGYVELVLVADHAEFQLYPDVNQTAMRLLEIAFHMDGFYRPLGLRVAVVGVEVWDEGNRVAVDGPPRATLERFLKWRQEELLPRIPHDNAQLIMGAPFYGGSVGAATQGSICSGRSGGVSTDHSVGSLVMASTLSHQLGHNLGLDHVGASCGCDGSSPNLPPGRSCIMEKPTGVMPGLSFSSCSQRKLQEILTGDQVWCLLDVPEPARLVDVRCGNRLVESGEECDCGLREECADPCCNASTCKLNIGAQCATGDSCCQECKLRSAGFVCREPRNECDLPEFCNGVSPRCPSNVHKQDGTPCGGGKAICYGGICPTYSSQCQEFWGPGSIPVSDACAASLNSRGDQQGHCGQRANGSYIPCAPRDVWCGRLQCQGGSANARKPNSSAKVKTCPNNTLPLTSEADDILDLAMVLPGTSCGAGKFCVEQRCQDLATLNLPVCQCNGRGVCNNKGHCHCQPGWAPPDCQSGGVGGSIDSGPAVAERGSGTSTALLLSALLLVFLLGLALCCAKRIGLHKRLCQFGKGTSCQYRITQPEPGSYSQAPPERPRPPQWRRSTELQLMQTSKPPGPAKPPPPRKPLPSDPPRPELCAVPSYDPHVPMLPSRPAPPPPPTATSSSAHAQDM